MKKRPVPLSLYGQMMRVPLKHRVHKDSSDIQKSLETMFSQMVPEKVENPMLWLSTSAIKHFHKELGDDDFFKQLNRVKFICFQRSGRRYMGDFKRKYKLKNK